MPLRPPDLEDLGDPELAAGFGDVALPVFAELPVFADPPGPAEPCDRVADDCCGEDALLAAGAEDE